MKILVVDDDSSILALLKGYLTMPCDHDVEVASSGMQALEQIARASKPFDCFLVDIQMPNINGVTLVKKIRELEKYRLAPIIMLTAMSQREYVDKAFAAGANDYITKPFDFLELNTRIEGARRLLEENKRNSQKTASLSEQAKASGEPLQVPLDEPLNISGIDRVVGYTSFENYIMQLSRGRMFGSTIFAVQLSNAQKVYDDSTFTEFRNIIHIIAEVISATIGNDNSLLSYRGNGVFMCVKHGHSRTENCNYAQDLNRALASAAAGKSLNANLRLAVGNMHSLRWVTKSGALNSLYKAVQDVEAKTATVASGSDISTAPKAAKAPTPYVAAEVSATLEEDAALEERAYKNLLRDILREEEIFPEQLATRRAKQRVS